MQMRNRVGWLGVAGIDEHLAEMSLAQAMTDLVEGDSLNVRSVDRQNRSESSRRGGVTVSSFHEAQARGR